MEATQADGTPPARSWRAGLPSLLTVAALAILTTWLFRTTDWDVRISAWFFEPDPPGSFVVVGEEDSHWPYGWHWLPQVLYRVANLIPALFGFMALAAILHGSRPAPTVEASRARRLCRLGGIYLAIVLALGPGLLVNVIGKPYMGRTRPRHTNDFDGDHDFVPVGSRGRPGRDKSFPCGHASVGFALCALWFWWRRRRPGAAWGALVGSLVVGGALGMGRVAQGAHYASDVLWSAYLPFFAAWATYYWILDVPGRAWAIQHAAPGTKAAGGVGMGRAGWVGYGALVVILLAGVLLGSPLHDKLRTYRTAPALGFAPLLVEIDAEGVDIDLLIDRHPAEVLDAKGVMRGFGFPGTDMEETVAARPEARALRYTIRPRGVAVERDGRLRLRICLPSQAAAEPRAIHLALRGGVVRWHGEQDPALAPSSTQLTVEIEGQPVDLPPPSRSPGPSRPRSPTGR